MKPTIPIVGSANLLVEPLTLFSWLQAQPTQAKACGYGFC
jgi:hypothetical protein